MIHVLILGTRGVPAEHGGFETFAEDLSLYLIAQGHRVTVYCQAESEGTISEDCWRGVRRILIPSRRNPLGTILFDWIATWHSCQEKGVVLTLGYNTGVFNLLHRLRQIPTAMNMDGIEWKRRKWTRAQRVWLWFNEWCGALAADSLIADHPEIARYLRRRVSHAKIATIPYGAVEVTSAPVEVVERFGLKPKKYFIVIARPEPENSVLEIVRAYSQHSFDTLLVVLGSYSPENNRYHASVMQAAGPGVKFIGAVYDRDVVRSLRFHAKAYLHGHTVGGTNPSLVESLAAGNAVIAHDNVYNRWVAGERAKYFATSDDLAAILLELDESPNDLVDMEEASRCRYRQAFTPGMVLQAYERLLMELADANSTRQLSFK